MLNKLITRAHVKLSHSCDGCGLRVERKKLKARMFLGEEGMKHWEEATQKGVNCK